MIGLPVTALTESAAPPRASPSSLRHHHSIELGRLGEGLGDADGVLPGHRVDDEEDVVRAGPLADLRQLGHQLLVDVETAGGVDDEHVAVLGLGLREGPLGDVYRIALGALLVDVGAGAPADGDELVDGRGPVDVAGRECDALAGLAEVAGELGAGGRLARSLQPGHQDHGRAARGEGEIATRAAHQRGQLLVDDLDHLLAGIEAAEHVGAEAALLDRGRELLDDLEVDVGLEQREADLAHRGIDVGLGQLSARADVGERRLEPV